MFKSIQGAQEELIGLQRLRNDVLEVAFDTLEDGTQIVVKDIQNYPPERPQQTYVRTGDYGRLTHYDMRRGGDYVEAQIDIPVEYAKWVRGNLDGYLGPAWMHVGRWDNVTGITRQRRLLIEQNLDRNLAAKIQADGL